MNTELPEQPPPGIPAPPMGKEAARSRNWMTAIVLCGIASILLLAILPLLLRSRKRDASLAQAKNNARVLGECLASFQKDYGRDPDTSTIALVTARTHTTWTLTDATSNDLFKQLFAAGFAGSEEMFFARDGNTKKPDNIIAPDSKILEPRECAFAYIPGASAASDPGRPVAVTPLIPGALKFKSGGILGKAVVLFADGVVRTFEIENDGRVLTPDGRDIFDPTQAYWSGKAPEVKWPK